MFYCLCMAVFIKALYMLRFPLRMIALKAKSKEKDKLHLFWFGTVRNLIYGMGGAKRNKATTFLTKLVHN